MISCPTKKLGKIFEFCGIGIYSIFGLTSSHWVAIGTIGTFLAVVAALIIALTQDRIREWWNRAKLHASISLSPPDCHQIELRNSGGGRVITQNCIYLRVRVSNYNGRKPAENAEVMISSLWEINESGNEKRRETFLPMNLIWSHYGVKEIRIPVGVFRHCDLGFIVAWPETTRMRFDTVVQPNPVSEGELPNVVGPGEYKFELIFTADNAMPTRKMWILEFDGIWVENEKEMLEKHIHIKEIL